MSLPGWLRKLLPILALIAITAAISTPIYAARILEPTTSDYDAHIVWTLRMLKRELPPSYVIAHPGLQLAIGFFYWAGRGRLGLWEAAVLVQVLAHIAAALVLYFWIGPIPRLARRGAFQSEALRVFLAVSLTAVAPLMLLALIDHKMYFGYIALANYHNPTVHLLRPFALVSFYFAARSLRGEKSPPWMVLAAAACMLAGMLTKPNYGIALLPALGVLALWLRWKKRPIDWWMLLCGQVLPILAVLAFQAELIYLIPDADGAGVMIAPFVVEAMWSGYLPLKVALSVVFPALVLAFNWQRLRRDDEMLLAWLAFFFAVVQLYLFAETGDRLPHGNFRWGAQTALLIVFVCSVRAVLRAEAEEERPFRQRWPIYAAYLLHLGAGAAYYAYTLLNVAYD